MTKPLKGYNEGYGSFFTRLFYYNQNISKSKVVLTTPIIIMQTDFLGINPVIQKSRSIKIKNKYHFNAYRFPKHVGYWEFNKLATQAIWVFYVGELAILAIIKTKLSKNMPALLGVIYGATTFHFTLNILGYFLLTNIG